MDPGRALFCVYQGIDRLPSGVWLLPCSERLCINPLHREMKSTHSYRWDEVAQLPRIRNPTQAQAAVQVDESDEDFQMILAYFANYGRARAETQTPEMLGPDRADSTCGSSQRLNDVAGFNAHQCVLAEHHQK